MTDVEFRGLVRSALLEATRREYAYILEAEDLPDPDFSPRYLRERARLLADPFGYARRRARPLWKRAVRTAACILLCAGIAFGGLMAFSPEARAWVAQIVAEWRETHTEYTFTGAPEPGADVGVWRPGYVPEGFEEIERLDTPGLGYVAYEDKDGVRLYFTYALMDQGSEFSNDNEHSKYMATTIESLPADLFIADEPGEFSYLIWADEDLEIAYKLSSAINDKELITIAESIEKLT